MSPVACVIDIGSNTLKSLVASAQAGALEVLHHQVCETRLGTGISLDPPRILPEALRAGVASVQELLEGAAPYEPQAIALVATSAVRSAVNGADFLAAVEAATGYRPALISGDEEARLIARGIQQDPAIRRRFRDFCLFDLGGGSLELIRFAGQRVEARTSLPLGAVRLTERFVSDPEKRLEPAAQAALRHHAQSLLQESRFPLRAPVVGTGGGLAALRTILAREQGLAEHPPGLPREALERQLARLAPLSAPERQQLTGLPPGRADILPAALLVFSAVLEAAGADHVTQSFYNLRYGLAAELLGLD